MKTFIVIPAYNEEQTITKVIQGLKSKGYNNIIVINDGSTDKTSEVVKKEKVSLYEHFINRGLGGALGTGLQAALQEGADIIVTFDADGQHDSNDVSKVIKPIKENKADFVIGSRILNNKEMPFNKKIANEVGNILTWLLFGAYVTDSQSGLRAFSKEAAQKIKVKTNKMEISSEFIKEAKANNLRIKEVPIKTIYTDYSIEKGQKWWHGFRVAWKLFLRRIMK